MFCFIFVSCFSVILCRSELVAVVQIIQPGQRTPVVFYPTDPYSNRSFWPVDAGELTNEGKLQLYELGHQTRLRYNNFLPVEYSKNELLVQSTDIDRVHMSVQTFLAGLYPPDKDQTWNKNLTWQPIPVHILNSKILTGALNCLGFLEEIVNVLYSDDPFKQVNWDHSDVYQKIYTNAELQVNNVLEVTPIYDALQIEDSFKYILPNWTNSMYPEPLRLLSKFGYMSIAYTDKLKQLTAGLWLTEILEYYEKLIQNPSDIQKYRIFSVDSVNIASILNILGSFDFLNTEIPVSLYFELKNINNQPVINIWRGNGTDVEPMTLLDCHFDCHLQSFRDRLQHWAIREAEWDVECNTATSRGISNKMGLSAKRLIPLFNQLRYLYR